MRLRILFTAAAALSVSGAALASGYVVNLQPANGAKLKGHAGLHSVDDKTDRALVRIVAPGLTADKRGTIRVLVMNLGTEPFEFGPDDVTLTLADGSELKKVPLSEFDRGYGIIKQEQNRANAVTAQNNSTMSMLMGQTQSGMTGGSPMSAPSAGSFSSARQTDFESLRRNLEDEYLQPGGKTLDALYQLLVPEQVAPKSASGGYLVFEMPKRNKKSPADADLPITITVRTGEGVHRFTGVLTRS